MELLPVVCLCLLTWSGTTFAAGETRGKIAGADSAIHTTIINATDGGVRLKCEVTNASPKPELEWKVKGGKVLRSDPPVVSEKDDKFNVTLFTTVTKTWTNHFQCLASQKKLGFLIEREIIVHEKMFKQESHFELILLVTAIVLILVLALLLLLALKTNRL
ncbi:butyrophilin subfamily 3 member A2-like [Mastacembelus armatus]|uniref:butyrophilin subfamily 3 member A2-like n=1 Tax=Mastacembelus armatus TaxID=205130 RepID=UPI000E4613B3|nr:butyrophilin subfamily 3 member A2-like [Mastacembelus armatus]